MITSKPKSTALFSIAIFVGLALAAAIWILIELILFPQSYLIIKIILAPILFVIVLIVVVKTYFSAVTVSLGNNSIIYQYYLGKRKTYKTSSVAYWKEEVVKTKKKDYRRLSIALSHGKTIHLSNQENENYDKVIGYLTKKVKVKDPSK
ncbi:MAG: hypothetical protein ACI8QD_002267 [Cyclobacteriaceae bacterium]|jgi:hypothetical protein